MEKYQTSYSNGSKLIIWELNNPIKCNHSFSIIGEWDKLAMDSKYY